ncbi:Imm45 family immunity protein [Rhizobium sp. NXC24]|uniref:Imm45 family immunity protein n=1 Tax=Rhizobium sp. NXC24 TaxID=2048897 RepID=UPI000CDF3E29|nr:Imm45 family immunity protein [Rhizobium sp. NXC24]AVA26073.1 hypothetical protein NXC24_PC01646 [Rhizobium sp. NXC24]
MSEMWKRISECPDCLFYKGTVFRFPAAYPYEKIVEFMLVLSDSQDGLKVVVRSGYKAGHIVANLPSNAMAPNKIALYGSWIVENWQTWFYPEGDPAVVLARHIPHVPEDMLES